MAGASLEDRLVAAVEKVDAAAAEDRISSGSHDNLKRWLSEPQYRKYAPRLLASIEADQWTDLDAMFWEVVPFGTGGRRGPMGELGSATINERTIAESADGLARYLKQVKGEAGGRAVVAYDTRNRSDEFARLTATTLAANGLKVFLFDAPRATPELSFAVRHLECDVGAMISASHNPPGDNGFKAYWSNGGQVLAPHDRGIIDCVYAAGEIPAIEFDRAVGDGAITLVGNEIDQPYLDAVTSLSLSVEREIPAIFSPLHGVGETSVYRVLTEAGFADVELFEPHRAADGNFPNVPDQLPNPERPRVFDPLVERAGTTGAEVLLASDPDADRLGMAVINDLGEFVPLSGNRIGVLLADYVLRKRAAAGTLSPRHYVIETLVTTPLIGAIARAHNVRVIDDLLVGFKYIGETMDREGPEKFVFGAEESLGYLAGAYARDKDAAVAALYALELAAELRRDGKTLLDRLDELFAEHGYFVEDQRSETCRGSRGQEQIRGLMQAFRERPPEELAGIPIERVRDYGRLEVRGLPGNAVVEELGGPQGDLLFFDSVDVDFQFSLAVRPSGTEPKIKFYFFAKSGKSEVASLDELKGLTDATLARVMDALSDWVQNVLQSA